MRIQLVHQGLEWIQPYKGTEIIKARQKKIIGFLGRQEGRGIMKNHMLLPDC